MRHPRDGVRRQSVDEERGGAARYATAGPVVVLLLLLWGKGGVMPRLTHPHVALPATIRTCRAVLKGPDFFSC